jgi:hypothetical protein
MPRLQVLELTDEVPESTLSRTLSQCCALRVLRIWFIDGRRETSFGSATVAELELRYSSRVVLTLGAFPELRKLSLGDEVHVAATDAWQAPRLSCLIVGRGGPGTAGAGRVTGLDRLISGAPSLTHLTADRIWEPAEWQAVSRCSSLRHLALQNVDGIFDPMRIAALGHHLISLQLPPISLSDDRVMERLTCLTVLATLAFGGSYPISDARTTETCELLARVLPDMPLLSSIQLYDWSAATFVATDRSAFLARYTQFDMQ